MMGQLGSISLNVIREREKEKELESERDGLEQIFHLASTSTRLLGQSGKMRPYSGKDHLDYSDLLGHYQLLESNK